MNNFADNIKIDNTRDDLLTDFAKITLKDRYLLEDETFQGMFARVAGAFADDQKHAQRLYDYMSKHWFMPSTPILSNAGTTRGLPISCFLNEVGDNLENITETWTENVHLASKGGGIGSYWGNIRSMGEVVGKQTKGKTCGIIPFIKVQDSLTLAISQGMLRRGSAAAYLPIHHPEIEEFLEMRKPTGGDPNRKALNLHQGICIDDKFMQAVKLDKKYNLLSPKDGAVIESISARNLWSKILTTRIETGEPYLLFVDTVNNNQPEIYRKLGLSCKTSNLCLTGDTKVDVLINGQEHCKNLEEIIALHKQNNNILIRSKNLETNKIEYQEILASAKTANKAKIIKITYNGVVLKLTPEHKVYTKNRGYVKAKNLKENDELDLD